MNQFRDLTMMFLIILALGVGATDPDNWTWLQFNGDFGADVANALHFLSITKPWCVVVMLALSLALFMTRIKY
jgi:hypothetical protein